MNVWFYDTASDSVGHLGRTKHPRIKNEPTGPCDSVYNNLLHEQHGTFSEDQLDVSEERSGRKVQKKRNNRIFGASFHLFAEARLAIVLEMKLLKDCPLINSQHFGKSRCTVTGMKEDIRD